MFAANRRDRSFQRRLTLTGLDRSHLQEYYRDIVGFGEKMLDRWRPGERINLDAELERFAVNFASKIYFGQDPEERHQNLAAISREITAKPAVQLRRAQTSARRSRRCCSRSWCRWSSSATAWS